MGKDTKDTGMNGKEKFIFGFNFASFNLGLIAGALIALIGNLVRRFFAEPAVTELVIIICAGR